MQVITELQSRLNMRFSKNMGIKKVDLIKTSSVALYITTLILQRPLQIIVDYT